MNNGDPLAMLALWNLGRAEKRDAGLAAYLADDLKLLKMGALMDRKRDHEIEQRLDRIEQALAWQAEQDGELWRAVKELARRLDGRATFNRKRR